MSFPLRISREVLTAPLLICYALCGAAHVAFVALNTLLPLHVFALGGTSTQVGLMFSLATTTSMVLSPAAGGWIDRIGAKPVLLPGITILFVISLTLPTLESIASIFFVVASIGVANASINTTNSVLAARGMDVVHRGEGLSLYYLASSLGIAAAPPAALTTRAWAGTFLAFAGVAAVALMILALAMSLPRTLMTAATDAPRHLRLFSRNAAGTSFALVLTTVGHSSIYAFLPLYVARDGHDTAVAWVFTTYAVWVIFGRAFLGTLSDRLGRVRVAVPAMLATAAGYVVLAASPSPMSLIVAGLLLATGAATIFPTLVALVLDRTLDDEHGVALGSVRSAWSLGVLIGSPLVGFVADRISLSAGFVVAGVAAALGALAFVVLEIRRRRMIIDDRVSSARSDATTVSAA